MKYQRIEDRIIEKLYPELKRLETRITRKVTKRVIDVFGEQLYPPESMFRKEFVKRVKEADKRISEGKGKTYSYEEFRRKFLGK